MDVPPTEEAAKVRRKLNMMGNGMGIMNISLISVGLP